MFVHRVISLAVLLVGVYALCHALIAGDALGGALFAAAAYAGLRNVRG